MVNPVRNHYPNKNHPFRNKTQFSKKSLLSLFLKLDFQEKDKSKKFLTGFTNFSSQTKKLGEILAKKFSKIKKGKRALVLGLEGDLGGGKTTFLQGFAKGLGIREKILSPTFVIMKKFKIAKKNFKNFYHIDCYRIKKPKEILDFGFKKIISNPQNIVAIEWADRVRKILPRGTLILKFQFADKNKRKITIKNIV